MITNIDTRRKTLDKRKRHEINFEHLKLKMIINTKKLMNSDIV